jgi:DNA recombination protein RmuC
MPPLIVHLLFLVSGVLTGAVAAWLVLKGKIALTEANARAVGEVARTALEERLRASEREVADLKTRLAEAEARTGQIQADLGRVEQERAALSATLDQERIQAREKLALFQEMREQFSRQSEDQFKVLAGEILDEKSRKFTEQNQMNLGQLLTPLRENIKTFQAKVEEVYVNESKDRSALMAQVAALSQLNTTLNQETQNLTRALKGDRKAQGNWGEILLDDVLSRAGLRAGQHYQRQGGIQGEGGRVIPDVVINLPFDRHLVVDSKMTLPDYRLFSDTEDDAERAAALKRHLVSIRAHIHGLSEKNYQTLYGLQSLDFVVMFVPLEPAFMLAVTHDSELFAYAWDRNVLLVSPSTLLFVVRTVAYLWRQEDIGRNAKEIATRGADLYDRLVGFVGDLQKVGERIGQAQESYDEARKKLGEGKGNVIRQAEMLKNLGVKPTKALPPQWVEPALSPPLPTGGDEPTGNGA